jgi:hypothetical protein
MIQRFETLDSTEKFFTERYLATASSMLDKGFSYSIELGKND